jgi:predicted RNA-binding Zn-ribbon protein involved in translation (DUF1610 family)
MGGRERPKGESAGKQLCCPGCGERLGVSYADRLDLGPVIVRRVLTVDCPRCGESVTWRPARKARGG